MMLRCLGVAMACWMLSADASAHSRMPGTVLVALEYRGAASFASEASRCAADAASRDLISGVVRSLADEGSEGAVYEGILQRVTEQALCGLAVGDGRPMRREAPEPCRATLSGAGDVRVRIKIPPPGTRPRDAWVVVTPIDVLATVTGGCGPGEMREMEKAYAERTTIEIPMPPGPLAPGRYPARPARGAPGRWVLIVASGPPDDSAAAAPGTAPARMGLSEQVVVTERLDQAAGATVPRAIAVVTAEDMERRQARTTPEALEEVPGVFVQKTNHGGGSPIVRGLVGNQVLVLVDGIRLNNSTFRYGPNQYLATIDPFALDRIEVVRGAGSVLFGSDALGGVVSVLTRQPALAASGHRLSGRALARVVSGGMEQSARVEGEYASRRVGVRAGVSARSFGDLHAGGALGVEAPSGYGELAADARLLARVSSSATVSGGWQLVHQDDVPRFDQVRQRGFERWSFAPQARQLAWGRYAQTTPLAWLRTIAVTGSWQHSFERRERQSRGSSLFVVEQDTVDSIGVLAEIRASPAPWLTVRYGLDVYRDLVGSGREDRDLQTGAARRRRGLYPDGARARSAELFGVATWSRGPVSIDTGVRRTWASVSASDALFGTIGIRPAATIGSVAAGYEAAPGLTLYAVAAQAFRAPNVDDVSTLGAFDFGVEVPSADLRPERSLTLETGVRWTASRLQISTGVWRLSLADLIDRVRGSHGGLDTWEGQRVYRRANVGDAYLRGFEMEGRAVLRGPLEASGFLAYAFGEQAATGQPMRRVPPLNGLAAVRWRGARLDAEAAWRLAARQDRLAPGDRDDHRINPAGTPGWQVLDLRGSYALSPVLRVAGRAGNLFDEAYRVHGSGIDGMGRHLAVSLHVGGR